jgi:hypothetical protein
MFSFIKRLLMLPGSPVLNWAHRADLAGRSTNAPGLSSRTQRVGYTVTLSQRVPSLSEHASHARSSPASRSRIVAANLFVKTARVRPELINFYS